MSARVTFATARRVLWQIQPRPAHDRAPARPCRRSCSSCCVMSSTAGRRCSSRSGRRFCASSRSSSCSWSLRSRCCGSARPGPSSASMTLPLAKLDLLVEATRSPSVCSRQRRPVVVCVVGFVFLGLDAPHGAWLVAVLAICNALLGMALGLFVSAFAEDRVSGGAVHAGPGSSRSCCCAASSSRGPTWRPLPVRDLLGAAAHVRVRRARTSDLAPQPLGRATRSLDVLVVAGMHARRARARRADAAPQNRLARRRRRRGSP